MTKYRVLPILLVLSLNVNSAALDSEAVSACIKNKRISITELKCVTEVKSIAKSFVSNKSKMIFFLEQEELIHEVCRTKHGAGFLEIFEYERCLANGWSDVAKKF
jgi:hypothetical protein